MKKVIEKNKRPAPFIAPSAKREASKIEIERQERRIKRAKEIGQDILRVDSEKCETENPYKVEALLYIMNDREVPEDLKDKIRRFDKDIRDKKSKQ